MPDLNDLHNQQSGTEDREAHQLESELDAPDVSKIPVPLHKHGHRFIMTYVAILVVALAAGAVYAWQHNKVASLDSQVASRNSKVVGLKGQVDTLQKKVSEAKSTSSSKKSSSSTPQVSACTNSEVSLSLNTNGGGTAGTIYKDAVVTNTSSVTCTLQGVSPSVTLVTSANTVLGTAVGQGTSGTVTLAPGATAHAAVGFPAAGAGENCSSQAAAYLDLILPGQSEPLQVADTDQYCQGFSVQAFTAGS